MVTVLSFPVLRTDAGLEKARQSLQPQLFPQLLLTSLCLLCAGIKVCHHAWLQYLRKGLSLWQSLPREEVEMELTCHRLQLLGDGVHDDVIFHYIAHVIQVILVEHYQSL